MNKEMNFSSPNLNGEHQIFSELEKSAANCGGRIRHYSAEKCSFSLISYDLTLNPRGQCECNTSVGWLVDMLQCILSLLKGIIAGIRTIWAPTSGQISAVGLAVGVDRKFWHKPV